MKKVIPFFLAILLSFIVLLSFPFPQKANYIIISFSVLTELPQSIQMFYKADSAEDFKEENSIQVLVDSNLNSYQKIKVEIPIHTLSSLKFDFQTTQSVKIKDIKLTKGMMHQDITQSFLYYNYNSNVTQQNNRILLDFKNGESFIQAENLEFGLQFPDQSKNIWMVGLSAIFLLILFFNFFLFIWKYFSLNLSHRKHIFLLTAALGIIFTPFFTRDQFNINKENRSENLKPNLLIENQINFNYPKDYETWFNDHFGMRNFLIDNYKLMNYNLFYATDSTKVLIGKEGWLFYGDESIENYQNLQLYTDQELEQIKVNLEYIYKPLKENDIQYVLVIAPDKETIYNEYYPDTIKKIGSTSKLDQVVDYLKEYSEVPVLDLRETLLANKADHPLYYLTDTHWNQYGAFLGYQAIVKYLSQTFSEIKPLEVTDFIIEESLHNGGDLLNMLGIDKENYKYKKMSYAFLTRKPYMYKKVDLVEQEPAGQYLTYQDTPNLPTALIYHDSFFGAMQPFFSAHFREASYGLATWNISGYIPQIIEQKPDIVVHELVERNMKAVFGV